MLAVPIGDCRCPGEPHLDGDIVYLHEELSMAGGMAAQGAIIEAAGDTMALQEQLYRVWVKHGIADWNFVDETGRPVPVTAEMVEARLPYGKGGRLVADKLDDLYAEDILAPLVERAATLSARGSTSNGQRPTSRTSPSTPRQRKRSSTATTGKAPSPG